MKRFFVAPIMWGFFLSAVAFSAAKAPHLRTLHNQKGASILPSGPAAESHLSILAIRVEFQPDTLSTTTGDGTFGSVTPEDVVVDPLPHDRAYFEDHLTFLGNYFAEVSGGKVTVDSFVVFPQASDSAYLLPNQMWHYNYNVDPSIDPDDLDQRLAELFVDSWEAAAQDPTVDPAGWDLFVIFHAGTGQDFDVGFDETPHDIPSAYFRLEDLESALEDPNGILVNGAYVTGGLLLPETERQYEVDAEIALNGTECLLFAQWIGIPALYNTEDGSSGVGRFDLMDQGSGNFAGMIPSRPCAWTRAFMGWETAQMIIPDAVVDTFGVKQTGRGDPSDTSLHEIYRVNLNESEYYLIENRSWDADDLGYTIAYDSQNRRLRINDDYTVEMLDGDFGVIVRVDNYDFGLPGEGILIWHIDDTVIEANYAENRVNADPSHRGVSLIEADGADDIGQGYGFLDIGYGTEFGWSGDFFFAGNQSFLNANPKLSSVRFYDDSHPGTRTNDGSPTGLDFRKFSEPDTVMYFHLKNDWAQQGFPIQLAEPSGNLSPSALDFNGDGQTDWILTATPGGAIQAFDSLGRAKGNVFETRLDTNLLGDVTEVIDTLLARVPEITANPAVDVYSDGFTAFFPGGPGTFYSLEYSTTTDSITVATIAIDGANGCTPLIIGSGLDRHWYGGYLTGIVAFQGISGILDTVTPFDDGEVIGMCLSDAQDTAPVFIVSSESQAALISYDLDVLWTIDLPFKPAFAPLALMHQKPEDNPRRDLLVVGDGGEVALLNPEDGAMREGFPLNVGMDVSAPPAAADFDEDGWLEVILIGANRIIGVQANGVLSANWPLHLDNRRSDEPILSPPAISEIGQDGLLRVFFGWPDGGIDARDRWGGAPDDFPRSTGSTVRSAPLLVQLDAFAGDTETELLALSEDGVLYAWHLEQQGFFEDQRRPWNGWMGGNKRQGIAYDPMPITFVPQGILETAKVYPWPNPAKEVTHIRYRVGQSGRITVRIFDGAGDLVKELTGTAEAGLEGELEWNLADVSSGIYVGRVEVESNGKKENTFIKIAVVK